MSTKNGCTLRKSGSPSYTCMRELVRDKLSSLGYDASQYGLHSFRAGDATAATNSGVPDRLSNVMEDGGQRTLKTVI